MSKDRFEQLVEAGLNLGMSENNARYYSAQILAAELEQKSQERKICETCGHPKRKDCDGKGWLEAIGPCADGSYITSRPCPYENPYAAD